MQDHHKTHTHELEYKCNQCDKAFRKKISLHRHLEYHTGMVAKPFICDFCGKAFRLNANLVVCVRSYVDKFAMLLSTSDSLFLLKCLYRFRNIDESIRERNHTFVNIVHQTFVQCPVFIAI